MQEAAAAEAGPRAPPAQGVESAAGATDRSDPPPRHGQGQAEEASDSDPAKEASGDVSAVVKEVVAGGGDPGGEASCDMYNGRWVYDEANAPLYKEDDCEFLTEQVVCMRNGRRSDEYQKWRWQPDGCDLPRYATLARRSSQFVFPCIFSIFSRHAQHVFVHMRVRDGYTHVARRWVGVCFR